LDIVAPPVHVMAPGRFPDRRDKSDGRPSLHGQRFIN
jgi:hypothetical protein